MATKLTANGVSTTTTPGSEQYDVFYTGYDTRRRKHCQYDYRHTDGDYFPAWLVHSKSADNAVMNGSTRKSTTEI